ncbi:MAG TPA: hypothetical protein ENK47_07320 [Euryarchaeota archaeon]|nr:hypothetical protein [Euryarchaeota archaeon]
MTVQKTENLFRKVIVRFRYKAGKNGQIFPQRSWDSGLLMTFSNRLILASGPFMQIIPLSSILSIEDEGTFPLSEDSESRIIPLVHLSGLDAYLTVIGVTPPVRTRLTEQLYQLLCSFHGGYQLMEGGEWIPVTFHSDPEGIMIRVNGKDSSLITPSSLKGKEIRVEADRSILHLHLDREIVIASSTTGCKWLAMFLDHYVNRRTLPPEERYLKVLRYLSRHPSSTGSLTANLGLVALEASTILNEMVFLEWVELNHYSKLYTLTERGSKVLAHHRESDS